MNTSPWYSRMSDNELNDAICARNSQLFNLRAYKVGIIGAGAIGSFTASSLTRSGIGRLAIFDNDSVAPENIGVQDYMISQVDLNKAIAIKRTCMGINPTTRIYACPMNVEYDYPNGNLPNRKVMDTDIINSLDHCDIIVLAVDSMEARLEIMDIITTNCEVSTGVSKLKAIIDARMGSETLQLYIFHRKLWHFKGDILPGDTIMQMYSETWYSDEDGDSEPCAARSTAYCSTIAGSIITSEIKKIVKEDPVKTKEIVFNFPTLLLDAKIEAPKL